jgi:hypothetical protein
MSTDTEEAMVVVMVTMESPKYLISLKSSSYRLHLHLFVLASILKNDIKGLFEQ